MTLIFSLSHNNSVNTRPGLKEQTNDITFPLISLSYRGGLRGGQKGDGHLQKGGNDV